jgi:ketosteroid isomerase-like protein
MTMDPVAVVERYLATVGDLATGAGALEALVHPDARFVERPNLVAPAGRRRDAACALAALRHSRALMNSPRFDALDHIVAGERVVTRAVWRGTLAVDAGAWPAGTELRADCCMVFTVREDRILEQENYDCYHPVEVPGAAA